MLPRVSPPPLLLQKELQCYFSHQSFHETCHLCTLAPKLPATCHENKMEPQHASQCSCVISSSQITSKAEFLQSKKPRVKTDPFLKLGITPLYYKTDHNENTSYCIFTKNQVKKLLQYLNEAAQRIYDQHIRLIVLKQLCPLKKNLFKSFTEQCITSHQLKEQVEWFVAITQAEVVSYRQKAWRLLQENNKLKVLLQNKDDERHNNPITFIQNDAFPLISDDSFLYTASPSLRNRLTVSQNEPLPFQKSNHSLKKQKHHSKRTHRALKKKHFLSEKEDYLLKKEERLLEKEKGLVEKENGLVRKEKSLTQKEDTLVKEEESLLRKQKNAFLKKPKYPTQNDQIPLKKSNLFLKNDTFSHQDHVLLHENSPIDTSKYSSSKNDKAFIKKTNSSLKNQLTLVKTDAIFERNTLNVKHQNASPQHPHVLRKKNEQPLNTKHHLPTTEMYQLRNHDFLLKKEGTQSKDHNLPLKKQHSLLENSESPRNSADNSSTIYDTQQKNKHYNTKSMNEPQEKCDTILNKQNSILKIKNPLQSIKTHLFKKNDFSIPNEASQAKDSQWVINIQHSQALKHDGSTNTDPQQFKIQEHFNSKNTSDLVNKVDLHLVSNKLETNLLDKELSFLSTDSVPLTNNNANLSEKVSKKFYPIKTNTVSHVVYANQLDHNMNASASSSRRKNDIFIPINSNQDHEKRPYKNVDTHNSVKLCQNRKQSPSISPFVQRELFDSDNTSTMEGKKLSHVYTGNFSAVSVTSSSDIQSNETSLMPLSASKIDFFENPVQKQFRYDMNDFLSPYPITMDTEDENNASHIIYPLKNSDDCLISKTFETQISKNNALKQPVNGVNKIIQQINLTESSSLDEIDRILNGNCLKENQNSNTLVESRTSEHNSCKSLNSAFCICQNSIEKTKYFTVKTQPLFPTTSYNVLNEEPTKDNKNLTILPATDLARKSTHPTEHIFKRNKSLHEFSFNKESKSHISLKKKKNHALAFPKNDHELSTYPPIMMRPSSDNSLKVRVLLSDTENVIDPYANKQILTNVTTTNISDAPFMSNGVRYELMRQKLLKKQAQDFVRSNITFQSDDTSKKVSCNPENEIKRFLKRQLDKIKQEIFNSKPFRKNHFKSTIS